MNIAEPGQVLMFTYLAAFISIAFALVLAVRKRVSRTQVAVLSSVVIGLAAWAYFWMNRGVSIESPEGLQVYCVQGDGALDGDPCQGAQAKRDALSLIPLWAGIVVLWGAVARGAFRRATGIYRRSPSHGRST